MSKRKSNGKNGRKRKSKGKREMRPASVARRALMMPEILALIIDFAITKPNDKEILDARFKRKTRIMTVEDTPWPFMLVSKTWHEIISSTPILWSAFFALTFDGRHLDASRLSPMLDVYLQRSKSLPLTFWIIGKFNLNEGDDISSLPSFINLIEQAFLHQHRWEDVRLDLFCLDRCGSFMTRPPVTLTVDLKKTAMLKRMESIIFVPSKCCGILRLALAQCNSLEVLHLDGPDDMEILVPSSTAGHVPIYLPNLRNLRLDSRRPVTHVKYWTVLGASPNIVDLTLRYDIDDEHVSVSLLNMPPLTLSKLRNLNLRANPMLYPKLLDHMDLPSLTHLYLDKFPFDDRSLFEMAGLMHRQPLTSLVLQIGSVVEPLSELALKAFLLPLTELERLCLDFWSTKDIRESVFQMLALALSRHNLGNPNPNQPAVLPRLTTLDLTASPSVILVKDGASSIIKDIIITCKRRHPSKFHVSIKCRSWGEDLCDTANRLLFEDVQIRQCVTETFSVMVNYKRVQMSSNAKGKRRKKRKANRKRKTTVFPGSGTELTANLLQ